MAALEPLLNLKHKKALRAPKWAMPINNKLFYIRKIKQFIVKRGAAPHSYILIYIYVVDIKDIIVKIYAQIVLLSIQY